ncbi:5-oxoprolinase subunit PxpB [Evansella tamaricis]|uniref:5-oxoprolinase subunit PxpB n=1 Tax=Evansella tamaricis TaxID=2069301 RepID=A0ABS6JKZ6_9BACI|nr:5-oxoprolinase subunit PxpB [Evansella tamaricis]MBU9714361.1 5-oxoprolinase subunit PxpB [Evansella tamaricis]
MSRLSCHGGTSIYISPLGDRAVRLEFGTEISEQINDLVHRAAFFIREKQPVFGVEEIVPAYSSLTLFYNPLVVLYEDVVFEIEVCLKELIERKEMKREFKGGVELSRRLITIPVLYGGEVGPDLQEVASLNGITAKEVVELHSKPIYRVFMMGFAPGFPYLGGMSEKIATPRRKEPRVHVEAGSVGIAGSQTGVYSVGSPGGWQIIGKTPVPLFDPYVVNKDPVLFHAGDMIQFIEINKVEYNKIFKEIEAGIYPIDIVSYPGGEGKRDLDGRCEQ